MIDARSLADGHVKAAQFECGGFDSTNPQPSSGNLILRKAFAVIETVAARLAGHLADDTGKGEP